MEVANKWPTTLIKKILMSAKHFAASTTGHNSSLSYEKMPNQILDRHGEDMPSSIPPAGSFPKLHHAHIDYRGSCNKIFNMHQSQKQRIPHQPMDSTKWLSLFGTKPKMTLKPTTLLRMPLLFRTLLCIRYEIFGPSSSQS